MEPLKYHHTILIFSIFYLIQFNSANATCLQNKSTNPNPSPSPYASSISQLPETVPFPILPKKSSILPILPSLLEAIPQSTHNHPSIKKICDSTDYPDVCISSIAPFLKGKTDTISVVGIAIKVATQHTKLAIGVATKIASSGGTSSDVASTIRDCKDNYNDALDNFQKAIDALPSRDVGTMNSMLSAAITDFSDNDDSLSGKGFSPLLLEFNGRLTKMTSNCLAIVSLIK